MSHSGQRSGFACHTGSTDGFMFLFVHTLIGLYSIEASVHSDFTQVCIICEWCNRVTSCNALSSHVVDVCVHRSARMTPSSFTGWTRDPLKKWNSQEMMCWTSTAKWMSFERWNWLQESFTSQRRSEDSSISLLDRCGVASGQHIHKHIGTLA